MWIDEGELKVGDSLVQSIAGAVEEMDFLVALVSPASVDSPWCRRELAQALTGEVDLPVSTVLPLRLGDVEMPPEIRDRYWLPVDLDRPEAVVHTLYDHIRSHHRTMRGEGALEVGRTEFSSEAPPGAPPPESRPLATGSAHSPVAVRATFLDLRRREDQIGIEELLRTERRSFEAFGRELIAAAQEDSPGRAVDMPRFAQLEGDLSALLERRLGTLFPLVEYGPSHLLREEIRAIAELTGRDWRLGPGSFGEWMQSPRWLAWCLTWALGAVATARGRFEAVRLLWEAREEGGEPLPITRLLAASKFAEALQLARFGKRLKLGPFWHLGAILSKSDLCSNHYTELSPNLERALHQLSDFSWLVTALAGRDQLQVVKWWLGVTDLASDEAGASIEAAMDGDPELLGDVAQSVFGLPRHEESLVQMGRWVLDARGPETFF